MEIKNFDDLIVAAAQQPDSQRLLMLYAKADMVDEKSNGEQPGGTITPVMCVDKTPEEISSFASLVEEADAINKNWDFIFVAGMSGQNGNAPTSEEAEPILTEMTNALANGYMKMDNFLIFDREQAPIFINKID